MSVDEVYRHHRDQLNLALRRPGMYSRDESAEHLLLEAMAAVDGRLEQWRAELDALRDSPIFAATGVSGFYATILPRNAVRDAATSGYAEIAHRLGWLDVDRVLSADEYVRLDAATRGWTAQDRTWSDVIGAHGQASLLIGGSHQLCPKTLVYATADPSDGVVCIHLWNARDATATADNPRGVRPEPVVLAVRHDRGDFTFTPEGSRRRPPRDPARRTVWIFNGAGSRWASAVFDTAEAALAWAAESRVTGVLTEYAFGGAYDVALRERRFTPSKPHHGTPDHIAGFSPGLRHIHLTDGLRD